MAIAYTFPSLPAPACAFSFAPNPNLQEVMVDLRLPPVPADLKHCLPFVQRAQEVRARDPYVCYWSLYYVARLGMGCLQTRESKLFLAAVVDQLETMKRSMKTRRQITDEAAGSLYIRRFGFNVFEAAKNEDAQGNASRATAKKFLAASNFLEILRLFGPLDAEASAVEETIRYAKFKAGDIVRSLRESVSSAPAVPARYTPNGQTLTPSNLSPQTNPVLLSTRPSTLQSPAESPTTGAPRAGPLQPNYPPAPTESGSGSAPVSPRHTPVKASVALDAGRPEIIRRHSMPLPTSGSSTPLPFSENLSPKKRQSPIPRIRSPLAVPGNVSPKVSPRMYVAAKVASPLQVLKEVSATPAPVVQQLPPRSPPRDVQPSPVSPALSSTMSIDSTDTFTSSQLQTVTQAIRELAPQAATTQVSPLALARNTPIPESPDAGSLPTPTQTPAQTLLSLVTAETVVHPSRPEPAVVVPRSPTQPSPTANISPNSPSTISPVSLDMALSQNQSFQTMAELIDAQVLKVYGKLDVPAQEPGAGYDEEEGIDIEVESGSSLTSGSSGSGSSSSGSEDESDKEEAPSAASSDEESEGQSVVSEVKVVSTELSVQPNGETVQRSSGFELKSLIKTSKTGNMNGGAQFEAVVARKTVRFAPSVVGGLSPELPKQILPPMTPASRTSPPLPIIPSSMVSQPQQPLVRPKSLTIRSSVETDYQQPSSMSPNSPTYRPSGLVGLPPLVDGRPPDEFAIIPFHPSMSASHPAPAVNNNPAYGPTALVRTPWTSSPPLQATPYRRPGALQVDRDTAALAQKYSRFNLVLDLTYRAMALSFSRSALMDLGMSQSRALAPVSQAGSGKSASASDIVALGKARGVIDAHLTKHASRIPPLDETINASASTDYTAVPNESWDQFYIRKAASLPDGLFEHIDTIRNHSVMGLLPEINYAWIVLGNILLLWDYTNPSSELVRYDQQQDLISHVGLVKPKPGVFVDSIQHLLVVCTPLQVQIIGVEITNGDMKLYETDITLSTDAVEMKSVVSSKQGRIFMIGHQNGCLYELTYQAAESWFSKKSALVNHSTSGYANFIPSLTSLIVSKLDHRLLVLVSDPDRKCLYALTDHNHIIMYHLGLAEDTLKLVIDAKDLRNVAQSLCPSVALNSAAFRICDLTVLPPSEGTLAVLVAVTTGGARLYFSHQRRGYASYGSNTGYSGAPSTLQLIHVRPPPAQLPHPEQPYQNPLFARDQLQALPSASVGGITRAAYRMGLLVAVQELETGPESIRNSLFVATPDL
ncbi:hypothetical protein FRC07_003123, partial [Ceratobasidium sp. 392]